MNCKKIKTLLSLYIDQQLSEKELKEVEEHLKICDLCNEELNIYKTLLSQCNNLNEDKELPNNFHRNLMNKINDIKTKHKRKGFTINYRVFTTAAAIFIAVMVITIVLPLISPNEKDLDSAKESDDISTSQDYADAKESSIKNETDELSIYEESEETEFTSSNTNDDSDSINESIEDEENKTPDNDSKTIDNSNLEENNDNPYWPYIFTLLGVSGLSIIYIIFKRRI